MSDPAPTPPSPPTPPAPALVSPDGAGPKATLDEMREAMKEIFDPEIPINIVDLGLIYNLAETDGKVNVDMTLTSPHCPVGDQLKARVNDVLIKGSVQCGPGTAGRGGGRSAGGVPARPGGTASCTDLV